ncbi:MAG: site-specific integrase [Nocardioidaceae bacterium]|nr:site-specific integrase [Nocardioidaceae bacterium]
MAISVQAAERRALLGRRLAWRGGRNDFLRHLRARAFSPATVRAYAFDVANLARFLEEQNLALAQVESMDDFAWVDWQVGRTPARCCAWPAAS